MHSKKNSILTAYLICSEIILRLGEEEALEIYQTLEMETGKLIH